MKSIRSFLIVATLAAMVLLGFVAALQGYRSSMVEAERMFDGQLLELSQFAADLRIDRPLATEQPAHIAYQIWDNNGAGENRLLVRTSNAPSLPMAEFSPGFDYANFNSYRWRTHTYFPAQSDLIIQVASRIDVRYQLAENVIIEAIYPIVLGLPLSGLLIWLIVGRGMRPLKSLSEQLKQKEYRDLTPISLDAVPQELNPVVNAINALLQRLSSAFNREKSFASDAAHELRTPLSVLKLQIHNLETQYPQFQSQLTDIKAGANRMQHLIEQILALYRTSPEQMTAQFVAINMRALCEQVIADHFNQFENKQQEIELLCDLEPDEELVDGDTFALQTLLGNLLSNANKYTPKDGDIKVKLYSASNHIHLLVEDSGPGIPEEQRQRVFQRFHRMGGDRHNSGETGCGLGLAIVENIVALHRGTIAIETPASGSGTCFHVTLPRRTTDSLTPSNQHHVAIH